MKGSILFRLNRFISFILKGIGKIENEHYLFTLEEVPDAFDIYKTLADWYWQPNYMGYSYKHQIYQCRQIVDRGKHQYHLRFYDDGKVTGHFERTPEWDCSEHLLGVDLRIMNAREIKILKRRLGIKEE